MEKQTESVSPGTSMAVASINRVIFDAIRLILKEKCFNSKLSGNEIYYTA